MGPRRGSGRRHLRRAGELVVVEALCLADRGVVIDVRPGRDGAVVWAFAGLYSAAERARDDLLCDESPRGARQRQAVEVAIAADASLALAYQRTGGLPGSDVVPTPVGVFPIRFPTAGVNTRRPHARGGVPANRWYALFGYVSSPRPPWRGCRA